jgi:hypothetical protein
MKKRQHTPEQIIRKLAEGEKLLGEGRSIGCRGEEGRLDRQPQAHPPALDR